MLQCSFSRGAQEGFVLADNFVQVFDTETGYCLSSNFPAHPLLAGDIITRLACREDSVVALGTKNGNVLEWNVKSSGIKVMAKEMGAAICDLYYHGDKLYVSCGNNVYRLTCDQSNNNIISVEELFHSRSPNSLILPFDDYLVIANEELVLVDPSSKQIASITSLASFAEVLTRNEDGSVVVTVCGRNVQTWMISHSPLGVIPTGYYCSRYRVDSLEFRNFILCCVMFEPQEVHLLSTRHTKNPVTVVRLDREGSREQRLIGAIPIAEKRLLVVSKRANEPAIFERASYMAEMEFKADVIVERSVEQQQKRLKRTVLSDSVVGSADIDPLAPLRSRLAGLRAGKQPEVTGDMVVLLQQTLKSNDQEILNQILNQKIVVEDIRKNVVDLPDDLVVRLLVFIVDAFRTPSRASYLIPWIKTLALCHSPVINNDVNAQVAINRLKTIIRDRASALPNIQKLLGRIEFIMNQQQERQRHQIGSQSLNKPDYELDLEHETG